MLQHESQEPTAQPVSPSASQIRVTPEELSAAMKALEEQQAGTVAIGSVVDELRLNASSEQIWEQVQKQRAEKGTSEQAAAQTSAAVTVNSKAAGRRRLRTWHDIQWWVWVLFWCSGGLGLFSAIPHWMHHSTTPAPVGIEVSGSDVTANYTVQGTGPQRDVTVSGSSDKITLNGDVRTLHVTGDENTVTVIGSVQAITVENDENTVTVNGPVEVVSVDNDGNTIHWTKEPVGHAVQQTVSGDDNKVGLSGP